ncbi:MAG: nucleoside deaminase [Clostridia bacterium]|nr:nucleoside deaminase [Clostridia bacterium]
MEPGFSMTDAEKYMLEALKEAEASRDSGEIPVGCVIVDSSGNIISRAGNTRESALAVHGHAEINALNRAAASLGTLDLSDCSVFVTLQPCLMCTGAIAAANVSALYFGASATSVDGFREGFTVPLNACSFDVYRGICEESCSEIIKEFFRKKREKQTPEQ